MIAPLVSPLVSPLASPLTGGNDFRLFFMIDGAFLALDSDTPEFLTF